MKNILRFAIPLILGYILQQTYLIIDAAVVGRFVSVGALAAIGASSSITFLIMGFCNGACGGFAIPVAQAFGARDYGSMRRYVAGTIRLAILFSLIITAITCVCCGWILRLVNTPEEILDDAYIYLFIQFVSIPFTFGYNQLSCFIRALGNSKQPFYFLIFSSVLNIILDVIFVVGVGMGVEGVGIATMISQGVSMLLCIVYIRRRMEMLIPRGEEWKYDRSKTLKLLDNGIPMGLQFSITAIGSIMLQSANNALGLVYVAAFTTSMRVKFLFTCVFENIGVAMATYCGQNLGARKMERVKSGIYAALKITAVYFVIIFVLIMLMADYMIMPFVDSTEQKVISNGAMLMRIACCFYPFLGTLTVLRYSIQGLGYSNLSMMSGVMEMIARIGVSLWVVPVFAFTGVCFGDPLAWVFADIFLIPCIIYLYRRLSRAFQ